MARPSSEHGASIESARAEVFVVPTDRPESDGTIAWDRTTIVIAHVRAGSHAGLGYAYAHAAAAQLIEGELADAVCGRDALDVPGCHDAMVRAARNVGRPGIASMAISALDAAIWDLKGKLLGCSVVSLLGEARDEIAIYGSGGFTSYDDRTLAAQLAGWVEQGIPRVKMKVGREPARDPHRVALARRAIGPDAALYVDANGAWTAKQALEAIARFAEAQGVRWAEEPVSSDDLEGLRFVRERAPARVDVAAGEYGWDVWYFQRMLAAGAVDVIMPDVTRCGGITGFLRAAAVADAHQIDVSAHCAPALSVHAACAAPRMRSIEWFHDHVRIEAMLFDGAPVPERGCVRPDRSRPGLGLELKRADAARFAQTGDRGARDDGGGARRAHGGASAAPGGRS